MDVAEGYALIQGYVRDTHRQVLDQLSGLPSGAAGLAFREGLALCAMTVSNHARMPALNVTVGVLHEVPLGHDIYVAVNGENQQTLIGRVYLRPTGPGIGAVVYQEVLPLPTISWEHLPSLQHVAASIKAVLRSALAANEALRQFGGRPFDDREAWLVAVFGEG
jgi:hypothetical protein